MNNTSHIKTIKKHHCKNKVAIILGYYNGQAHIQEQIHSILKQTHSAFHIYIFDDCSDPKFSLNDYNFGKDELLKISVVLRPKNIGFSKNFLAGLDYISDNSAYFAFCDQDDIWERNKLENAINAFENFSCDKPYLYCARTKIIDETGKLTLGYSPLFNKPPSFANSLVQNIAGGNTMLFNKAARNLIVRSTQSIDVLFHDWWCYMIVTGSGGYVIYDPQPCLKYRQHSQNLIGANFSLLERLKRIYLLFCGRFKEWNNSNLAALSANRHLLTYSNQKLLDNFIQARNCNIIRRLLLFKHTGIYRQTFYGNLSLLVAVIVNKV